MGTPLRPPVHPQHSPAPLGCIGLLIRGLMGAKPPTVKFVTSRGCKREKTVPGEGGSGKTRGL